MRPEDEQGKKQKMVAGRLGERGARSRLLRQRERRESWEHSRGHGRD